MKAKMMNAPTSEHLGLRHTVDMKPGTPSMSPHCDLPAAVLNTPEMAACFLKLREIVPALNHQEGVKLSKVQVLQGVIDYIVDLECTLDSDVTDAGRRLTTTLTAAGVERRPLCENTISNTQNAMLSGGIETGGASSC